MLTEMIQVYSGHMVIMESDRQQLETAPDSVDRALGKDLGSVPQVEQVFIRHIGDEVKVWIGVTDFPEEDVLFRIYDKESAAIDSFTWLDLDFTVIATKGHPIAELVSGAGVPAYVR